jgi:hypothetical protein
MGKNTEEYHNEKKNTRLNIIDLEKKYIIILKIV